MMDEPDKKLRDKILTFYAKKLGIFKELRKRGLYETVLDKTEGFSPADVKEVVQCLAFFGFEFMQDEIARVSRQREYYTRRLDSTIEKQFESTFDRPPHAMIPLTIKKKPRVTPGVCVKGVRRQST